VNSENAARPHLVIVTGLSGSGKSVALRALEDRDFYCIDNLPMALLPDFADLVLRSGQSPHEHRAVGIDIRNASGNLAKLPKLLEQLHTSRHIECEVLFLQADDDVIFQRYSETRRRHPLTVGDNLGLREAIAEERKQLQPVAAIADLFIDSTHTNIHELRQMILKRTHVGGGEMTILIESFAYKNGVPADVDVVFDVRCLPNPHWDPRLRPLTGHDTAVQNFLGDQALAIELLDSICAFLDQWLPRFAEESRSYFTVGIGCTGGRHRSVYLAERVVQHLSDQHRDVSVHHRELTGGD